jgi:hypothetical protein
MPKGERMKPVFMLHKLYYRIGLLKEVWKRYGRRQVKPKNERKLSFRDLGHL